jgi:hypothetical protein
MIVTTSESSRMVDTATKNAQTAGVGTNQNRERIVGKLEVIHWPCSRHVGRVVGIQRSRKVDRNDPPLSGNPTFEEIARKTAFRCCASTLGFSKSNGRHWH